MTFGYLGLSFSGLNSLMDFFEMTWQIEPDERAEVLLSRIGAGTSMKIDANRCMKCQLVVFNCEKGNIDAYKERQEYREKPKTGNFADVEKYLR